MISNLDKYRKDLNNLIADGSQLLNAMVLDTNPDGYMKSLEQLCKTKKARDEFTKKLPKFREEYQSWYSEAVVLIGLLLPARLMDFKKLFEKQKNRKKVSHENYSIEDYLQGFYITDGYGGRIVGPAAAVPMYQQQLSILKSVKRRFESSLFDIRQLVQADIFDSEIDAARELSKKGFVRGAGAVAGVIIENHLIQVCANHDIKIKKKNPGINDLAQLLKDGDVIETPQWRKIQHMADLRNLCDHKKKSEPSMDEINELIDGTQKLIKSLF